MNRKQRRRPVRTRKPGNDLRPFFSLLDDSHSKADFLEKVSRLSAIGRMALYGFRYWHKIRLSMTKLSPFYFGGWEALQSAIKSDGVWDVHSVPG